MHRHETSAARHCRFDVRILGRAPTVVEADDDGRGRRQISRPALFRMDHRIGFEELRVDAPGQVHRAGHEFVIAARAVVLARGDEDDALDLSRRRTLGRVVEDVALGGDCCADGAPSE